MLNDRSYIKLTKKHLIKLKKIVDIDQENFFCRKPKYKHFKDKLYTILLVQGAAKHYIDGINGIKDFDLLVLYKEYSKNKPSIYPKRVGKADCGMPEFGRFSGDNIKRYPNRRVDIMMREIKKPYIKEDIVKSIKNYFENEKTTSVKEWSKKAVVGIYPYDILGKVIIGD